MRTALTVLTDELRRLKAAGVKTIPVAPESMAMLTRALRGAAPAPRAVASKVEASAPLPAPKRAAAAAIAPASMPPPPTVALPGATKREQWDNLRDTVINDPVCRQNVRDGKKVVLGVGSLDAKIMFVGEAPGAEEEIQGEPFVGPAGQLLTKMIQAMGLTREEVYIGNIMNWRPQMPVDADGVQYGNRPPTAEEMDYCLPYLKAQIQIVAPAFLVALGATAAQGLLGAGSFKALSEVRSQWKQFEDRPLMITYHPSYILRTQSNRSKRMIWEDLLQVMERADLPISARQRAYFLDK